MINKLMTEINQKIERLNKLLEDEEYFRNLEIVIDRQNKHNQELAKKSGEKDKEIERLNNIINEALGIANERVNHYYHIKKKEILEDWEKIFDVLVERDNQELKGSDKE